MSRHTSDQIASSQPGSARRPTALELDRAEQQVADGRARVERLAKQIDDDMRRGAPTTHSRDLLLTCQEILRQMTVHRDAVFAEYMKRHSKRDDDSGPAPPSDVAQGIVAPAGAKRGEARWATLAGLRRAERNVAICRVRLGNLENLVKATQSPASQSWLLEQINDMRQTLLFWTRRNDDVVRALMRD